MAIIITEVTVGVLGEGVPVDVNFYVEWVGGTPPFAMEVETGDGDVEYADGFSNRYKALSHRYMEAGDFEWNITISDNYGTGDTTSGWVYLVEQLKYRNHIEWTSYSSVGGTWYLHTLYGDKVAGGFNYFASNSIAYVNHSGNYNTNIDVIIPAATPSGWYDAWTVISTTNNPANINSSNIIAERFDINAIGF